MCCFGMTLPGTRMVMRKRHQITPSASNGRLSMRYGRLLIAETALPQNHIEMVRYTSYPRESFLIRLHPERNRLIGEIPHSGCKRGTSPMIAGLG